MVKRQHKLMCLVLCLTLALASAIIGVTGAAAASGDTVYAKLNNGWSALYCYMWNSDDGNDKNASWPGVAMTEVEDGIYSYSVTSDDFDMIIFNSGSGGSQTADLSYAGNSKIYDLSAGTWSTYASATTAATTANSTTAATTASATVQPTTSSTGSGTTVYLDNEAGWSNVYCYMWNDSTDSNASWPGEAMTSLGDNVYQYSASSTYANCIFNSGSGGTQTADLTAQDGYVYNNSTNEWSVYDTSPLQVTSFTADPDSGVYIDSDVVLSASASNSSGATVYYQFTVTNSSGNTSTLQSYSTSNSVTWTPSTAGDYTISYEFKDSDGNTNSRTKSVTVGDDSSLVKPVIKGVTPAALNLIKINSATTVSVKAGGGNTGTNLLFYKYVVTDPNGVKNTPYYTLSSTYSFTPTMAGTYTVQVYVQGSDNSTVNKTYTYTASSSATEGTTAATPATTAQATTATTKATTATTATTKATTATTKATTAVTTSASTLEGDVDGDGSVTINDVTYLQKSIVRMSGFKSVSELDLDICDLNADGVINIKDATLIQMRVAGIS